MRMKARADYEPKERDRGRPRSEWSQEELRSYWRKKKAESNARLREARRTDKAAENAFMQIKVPVDDFRSWLQVKVLSYGASNVAASVGVTDKRISTFLQGYYIQHGKKYQVKYVTLHTLDEFMTPFQEHPYSLYPELLDVE